MSILGIDWNNDGDLDFEDTLIDMMILESQNENSDNKDDDN